MLLRVVERGARDVERLLSPARTGRNRCRPAPRRSSAARWPPDDRRRSSPPAPSSSAAPGASPACRWSWSCPRPAGRPSGSPRAAGSARLSAAFARPSARSVRDAPRRPAPGPASGCRSPPGRAPSPFTAAMKSFTTGSATSASSSAMRTSRSTSAMLASVRRAWPRRVLTTRAGVGQVVEHGGFSMGGKLDVMPDILLHARRLALYAALALAFLAHALERRRRGGSRRAGIVAWERAAMLVPLVAAFLCCCYASMFAAAAAALRLLRGAVGDALAGGAVLLDGEPSTPLEGHADAGAAAGRGARCCRRSFPASICWPIRGLARRSASICWSPCSPTACSPSRRCTPC